MGCNTLFVLLLLCGTAFLAVNGYVITQKELQAQNELKILLSNYGFNSPTCKIAGEVDTCPKGSLCMEHPKGFAATRCVLLNPCVMNKTRCSSRSECTAFPEWKNATYCKPKDPLEGVVYLMNILKKLISVADKKISKLNSGDELSNLKNSKAIYSRLFKSASERFTREKKYLDEKAKKMIQKLEAKVEKKKVELKDQQNKVAALKKANATKEEIKKETKKVAQLQTKILKDEMKITKVYVQAQHKFDNKTKEHDKNFFKNVKIDLKVTAKNLTQAELKRIQESLQKQKENAKNLKQIKIVQKVMPKCPPPPNCPVVRCVLRRAAQKDSNGCQIGCPSCNDTPCPPLPICPRIACQKMNPAKLDANRCVVGCPSCNFNTTVAPVKIEKMILKAEQKAVQKQEEKQLKKMQLEMDAMKKDIKDLKDSIEKEKKKMAEEKKVVQNAKKQVKEAEKKLSMEKKASTSFLKTITNEKKVLKTQQKDLKAQIKTVTDPKIKSDLDERLKKIDAESVRLDGEKKKALDQLKKLQDELKANDAKKKALAEQKKKLAEEKLKIQANQKALLTKTGKTEDLKKLKQKEDLEKLKAKMAGISKARENILATRVKALESVLKTLKARIMAINKQIKNKAAELNKIKAEKGKPKLAVKQMTPKPIKNSMKDRFGNKHQMLKNGRFAVW